MELIKEKFINILENKMKFYHNKISILEKDISDVILFLSIYASQQNIYTEDVLINLQNIKIPKVSNLFNLNGKEKAINDNVEKGTKFIINSYDNVFVLETIISKNYLSIKKKSDNNLYFYKVYYAFDKRGYFIREVVQNSYIFDKNLSFKETSKGFVDKGVLFSQIKEKYQNINIEFFKIYNGEKTELFYKNKFEEFEFMFRVKDEKNIPSIDYLGMKELNRIIDNQLKGEYIKIEDKKYYNNIKNIAIEMYKKNA